MTPEPNFAAQITDYCSLLGREKVTDVCEISDRTLRYWLSGTITPPKTTRAGAIMLLGCHVDGDKRAGIQSRIVAAMTNLPPYDPEKLKNTPITWPCNPTTPWPPKQKSPSS